MQLIYPLSPMLIKTIMQNKPIPLRHELHGVMLMNLSIIKNVIQMFSKVRREERMSGGPFMKTFHTNQIC